MFELGQKIATREAYGKSLAALGAEMDFVVLDADLAEATKTCYFGKAYPDRFFDCGIAEGNMIGIAAGLAAAGKTVVASSFAMFAAGRAFEQIRNSVAYPHLNVKICATHAGITVGEDGATHQCLEDIALMRSIPGMTVINPADAMEAAAALKVALETDGPFYIRLGRYAVPVLRHAEDFTFELGKGETLIGGSDVTIVTTGMMTLAAV
jgi:transketolase